MLLYLVSVGLVAAAIIGAFFGVPCFLLASPASETIADLTGTLRASPAPPRNRAARLRWFREKR
jgi:hypothetical protein